MAKPDFILNVFKKNLPKISFVARLHNSDVIGVEQEYIMEPVEEGFAKEVERVDFETETIYQLEQTQYITITEAVQEFKISRKKLYNLCNSSPNSIVAFQEERNKKWWIDKESLSNYILELPKKHTVRRRSK